MPSRPELRSKGNRPNSAIYLGNSPITAGPSSSKLTPTSSSLYDTSVQTPPSLPDLPEPPSPESSPGSRGSGLPSPPATNSTGSGSTGDPGSIALRQRPLSLASDSSGSSHRTVSERSATRSRSISRSSLLRDEPLSIHDPGDYEDDNDDLDGDQTARLDRRHHQTSEHNLALQRVKSLAERNRMAIDKLSSRLSSPSPSVAPSTTSSSRARQSRTTLPPDYGASGSETERESTSASSSSRRPITPPSGNHHVALAGTPSPYRRLRQASTPESPHKARLSAESSPSKNSPTARRRKRESIASIQSYTDEEDEDRSHFTTATGRRERPRDGTIRDITKSALAAVASSRTPLSTRRRGALPQEFIDSSDAGETRSVASRRSDDVREHKRLSTDPVTPYRGATRSSTVRETGRTSQAASHLTDHNVPVAETSAKRERRATLRGGSAESALRSPGRTLVSEGLRAAGLSRREEVPVPIAITPGDVFRNREKRAATPSRERAPTSMSNYRSPGRRKGDDEEPRRPPTSTRRQHRATYSTTESSEAADTEAVARPQRHSAAPRHSEPASHTPKRASQPAVTSTEHLRLMIETLQAFEANISKLPLEVTQSKASSASELLKHAQHVVHTTERINGLMRQGTSKALEEQIQAEVDVEESVASEEILHIWRAVGSEYREGLRASDDLVRALTSFLIDVGSTLRKLTMTCGEPEGSNPSPHVRSMSLEEDSGRSQAFSGSGYSLSGRKSVDLESLSRRSQNREEALRKLGGGGTGRESSLGRARASPALAAFRDRERTAHDTPSPASNLSKPPLSNHTPTNQGRRLFTPSQQRERELETRLESGPRRSSAMRPSDSQKTVLPPDADVEPSPTPASRIKERTSRALPPVPTSDSPPALSRLAPKSNAVTHSTDSSSASESVQRSTSTREHERRKPSIASIVTIRGSQAPPNLTTPSTALTGVTPTTVSHSPGDVPALLRTDSSKSRRSGITFSRPSTSALTGIQQTREGHRKGSYSVSNATQAGMEVPDTVQAPTREPSSRTFSKARSPPDLQTPRRPGSSPRVTSTEYVSSTVRNPVTPFSRGSTSHAADRHAASTMLPHRTTSTRERRRTVSDIFPPE